MLNTLFGSPFIMFKVPIDLIDQINLIIPINKIILIILINSKFVFYQLRQELFMLWSTIANDSAGHFLRFSLSPRQFPTVDPKDYNMINATQGNSGEFRNACSLRITNKRSNQSNRKFMKV